jgi:hypothetical protein
MRVAAEERQERLVGVSPLAAAAAEVLVKTGAVNTGKSLIQMEQQEQQTRVVVAALTVKLVALVLSSLPMPHLLHP